MEFKPTVTLQRAAEITQAEYEVPRDDLPQVLRALAWRLPVQAASGVVRYAIDSPGVLALLVLGLPLLLAGTPLLVVCYLVAGARKGWRASFRGHAWHAKRGMREIMRQHLRRLHDLNQEIERKEKLL